MIFKTQSYTVAEYEAFAADHPDQRFELIDGEIIEKMPTLLHGAIVSFLSLFIGLYLRDHPLGYVITEGRYALPDDPDNSHIPDLSFITLNKGQLVEEGAAPFMPDLAVEVQSPEQTDRLMANKAAYYLEHGSRMVWLVYPRARLVEVLTPEDRQLLTVADNLDGGNVLPGFLVAVKDIFPVQEQKESS